MLLPPHDPRPGPDVAESLRRQTHVLVRLAASSAVASGDFSRAAREITENAAAAMDVARVTIWLFDDSRRNLRCVDRFTLPAAVHEAGAEISEADYPVYFRSVLGGRTIDAHEAQRDPRLAEFVEGEFSPLGITAMMDTPVSVGARIVGAICFAHVGAERIWGSDEIIFASAMAHQVGLALSQAEKRRAQQEAREATERLREVFDHTTDCVFLMKVMEDGRLVNDGYNRTALVATGLAADEVMGRQPHDYLPGAVADDIVQNYRRCLATGGPVEYLETIDFGSGPRSYATHLVPIRNAAGRIHRVAGFARDVTDRVRADWEREEARHRANAQSAALIQIARNPAFVVGDLGPTLRQITELAARAMGVERVGVWMLDATARVLACADVFSRADGVHLGESPVPRRCHGGYFDALFADRFIAAESVATDPRVAGLLEEYCRPLGIGALLDAPVRVAGRIVGVVCHEHVGGARAWTPDECAFAGVLADQVAQLIANHERTRAERSLMESQRVLSTLLGNLPGSAYRCRNDADWTMEFISNGCHAMTGYHPEDFLGNATTSFERLTVPEDREMVRSVVTEALARRRTFELTYRIVHRDGRPRWVWERGLGVWAPDGQLLGIEGFITDITERREAELRLVESEEKFAKAFHSSPDALLVTDIATGRILDASEGFQRMFQWTADEALGKTTLELGIWADLGDRVRVLELVREQGRVRDFPAQGRCKDGTLRHCMFSAESVEIRGRQCLVSVVRDMSAQRQAEAARSQLETQLRQTQKLEALGQLAGGIAHDFNNILAAIIAYTELAEMDLGNPGEARRHLAQVRKAGDRAKDLVQQILAFSRQQKPERRPVRLHTVVGEALKLLRSTLPATIEIDARIDDRAPVVLADPTQVHQMVMNLCTNAAHAMRGAPGRLGIVLEAATVDEAEAAAHPEMRPGRFARLSVRDTGHGMDAATLKRIFEPFFTTKLPGEGTGLGLAVVHGIMKDHEGAIQVESRPGEGTCFRLCFPEHETVPVEAVIRADSMPKGRGERILFVDDERALCDTGHRLLTRLGYAVTASTEPAQALKRFLENPTAFDLVVTDLTMPGITGLDLATDILKTRPDLPVLLVSGFTGTWTPDRVQALGIRELIGKPLTATVLATAVRRHLDGGAPLPA